MSWTQQKAKTVEQVGYRVQHLEVVVSRDCGNCRAARALFAHLEQLQIPGVDLILTELDEPGIVRPEPVFAVPTYMLDGRVISLGNPAREWLVARLQQVSTQEGAG